MQVVLPDFQVKLAMAVDQLKICPAGRNQARSVRAGGESDQDIEVQVAEVVRLEAMIGTNVSQNFSRLEPVLLRRGQDRVVSSQGVEEFLLSGPDYTAQQFREDNRRSTN